MEFVEDWLITATLGEGAFGEVKLLHHRQSHECVALKILRLQTTEKQTREETEIMIKKEIQIHKQLKHENIVRFYGARMDKDIWYIFLEYADAGELFDRIEPDIGLVPATKTHPYFTQLISGLHYIHTLGIAHRDIKPENILLTATDRIKITDFGFATLYRNADGVERLLDMKCGTPPYVAPEVISKDKYKAMPVDVWSAGIVLVAMAGGELPWDRADNANPDFKCWKEGSTSKSPWNKLDLRTLSFIKKILCPAPSKRLTLEQIVNHPWICGTRKRKLSDSCDQLAIKKLSAAETDSLISRIISMSQPDPNLPDNTQQFGTSSLFFSFSQPAHPADEFFLPQKDTNSPDDSPINKLVKRMTRFFTNFSYDETVKELTRVLDQLCYKWRLFRESKSVTVLTISTSDRRKTPLVFKATLIEIHKPVDSLILLDFRLSRGDGLEFKRHFIRIKDMLKAIEVQTGAPLEWILN